jgi:hypothetical protein
MRTLLLAATALIGVSAAHANPATPAKPAGRYVHLTCSYASTAGQETWNLGFDVIDGHIELAREGKPETARWGGYTSGATTFTALIGDPQSPMNLAMVNFKDYGGLTWVEKGRYGVMNCTAGADVVSNVRPAIWHDPETAPAAQPAAAAQPAPQPAAAPAAAPAPAASLSSAPLTFDNQGMNVAVSLGTMPVTMVIDTGAIGMTVSQTVTRQLDPAKRRYWRMAVRRSSRPSTSIRSTSPAMSFTRSTPGSRRMGRACCLACRSWRN